MWRKIHEVSLLDLERCPVWEFAYQPATDSASDDESTVYINQKRLTEWLRPLPDAVSLSYRDAIAYVVATKFTLADGTTLAGISSPADPSGLDYEQPIIITPNGIVRLWYDWVPTWKEPERSLKRLGRSCSEIFPIYVEAIVPCESGFAGSWYKRVVREIAVPK